MSAQNVNVRPVNEMPVPNTNRPENRPQPEFQQRRNNNNGGSRAPWIVLTIVIILFLAVAGYLFRDKITGKSATAEKSSGYQAVFLTNGQVYFGKVSNTTSEYVTLKDIFYLQVNQPLQSGSAATPAQQQAADQQPQLSLVKLGNELHGPVDSMQINRTQILFFEDMKSDGKVAQAIAQYKENPNAATQNAPQQNTQDQSTGTSTQQNSGSTTTTPKK